MSHTARLLSTLLALSLSACASAADRSASRDDRVLGTPPPHEMEYIPDREPIVLVVYDISEEEEAALEAELAAQDDAPEEVTTTTTTTVVEEPPTYQVITSPQPGAAIPWSGGPIPDGYEGPVSAP